MRRESAFAMDTSSIKYGPGATREIGHDVGQWGVRRVMVVTDPNLAEAEPVSLVLDGLRQSGIDAVLFDQVEVEPTDRSFQVAIDFAVEGRFDGYVAVGGGSTIDTAKAANLYATYPAKLLDYVNPPVGKGLPVPGKLKPLFAVPTTGGTGSETTGVAIFDYTPLHAKTGIAHRALRPVLGVVDPINTRGVPPQVAACAGLDVLSHAVESLTALPFCQRPAPDSPAQRPRPADVPTRSAISGQGGQLEMVALYLVRSTTDPADDEARGTMLTMAATQCRRWIRQRGRVNAPRHVVPGLGHGPGLYPGGVPHPAAADSAWDVGYPELPGGFPLHRAGRSPSAP